MNSKTHKFPQVGVDQDTLPDGIQDAPTAEGSNWWSGRKTSIGGPEEGEEGQSHVAEPVRRKWRSTATEEMESFRPVPVVGRLPWRSQYMVCLLFLVVSLGALLYFSLSSSQPVSTQTTPVRQALSGWDAAFADVRKGQPPKSIPQIPAASTAVSALGPAVQKQWSDLQPLTSLLSSAQPVATNVTASAQRLQNKLGQAMVAAAPLWRQSGEGGEWTSVEAVNFAQVLSEIQYVQDVAMRVANQQADIPERVSIARQNIEQSFRVFAASPSASQNTPLTQAWRALAGGFVDSRSDLDTFVGNRQQWNALQAAALTYNRKQWELLTQLNDLDAAQTQRVGSRSGVWFAGTAVFAAVLFLMWIGWKQQRWRVLEAQSMGEKIQLAVDDLQHQLRPAAQGDLTTSIRPPDPTLRPLSDILNTTIRGLHALVVDVKKSAKTTDAAALNARETTGVLVDDARAHLAVLSANSEDIITLSQGLEKVSHTSEMADAVTTNTIEALSVGEKAVVEVRGRIHGIQEKTSEGMGRSQRVRQSAVEISDIAVVLNEVAEQMSVLAIQATLQAAKAGEAGQGFRVVADGLKTLSERSGVGARRVSALVEANLADLLIVEEAMKTVHDESEEGVRLSEVSEETTLTVSQRLIQLKELVEEIKTDSVQHDKIASVLAERTKTGLDDGGNTSQMAQEAADAIVQMVSAAQQLGQSALKFKVKG